MNSCERFHAVMNFRPFDRLPLLEWAPWWDKTIERWRGEGLPENCKTQEEICRHFDLDIYRQDWLRPIHPEAPQPAHHGAGLIADEAGYGKLRPFLFRMSEKWPVDPAQWTAWAKDQARGEVVLWITLNGFFWFPREIFGIERHLFAFYDQARLMHRINQENAEYMLKLIDRVCEFCAPDFMTFAEDMSYNHGPMLSKQLFDEFMLPYYRIVIPHLKKRGIWAIIDSDGDVTEAAGWFQEAGLDGVLPLERQAGVDVAELRRRYPRMRWIGHFDKMTMNQGESAMRAEFERLLPTARQGGFFISCDHQTPPGVSYRDYQLYLALFREAAVRAAVTEESR